MIECGREDVKELKLLGISFVFQKYEVNIGEGFYEILKNDEDEDFEFTTKM